MTWLRFALANLRHNALGSAVNVILLALGTASIVLLLLASEQFSRTLARDAQNVDLVLGAKGSPVQLILSSVYHADIPTGNIPLESAMRWAEDPRIAAAVPLSLGDSYQGFRIVGTRPQYAELYAAQLSAGRYWDAPMQAVLGASVARATGLALNDTFSGAHGLVASADVHEHQKYTVVGVLDDSASVLDRLILTSLESVWALHDGEHDEHEEADHQHRHDDDHGNESSREITAMLLRYASPMAAISLPRQINSTSMIQAASPAFELSRLLQLVGLGVDGLRAFAAILIVTAGFGIFAALYGALKSRSADLATLRCLGATRRELMFALLLEGLILSILGAAAGFALGHLATTALGLWLEATRGVSVTGFIWLPQESMLFLGIVIVGIVASALPAWQAYRVDVIRTLQAP